MRRLWNTAGNRSWGICGTAPIEASKSDLIILWGSNTAVTNHHFLLDVMAAKRNGAKVWLIDTYRTPTTKIADRILTVRPGTDGALAFRRDGTRADHRANDGRRFYRAPCSRIQRIVRTSPYGLSAGSGKLDYRFGPGSNWGTGQSIRQGPGAVHRLGAGLSRYGNGAMTVRTITCLPAIIGAWSRPGGGTLARTFATSAFDLDLITREDFRRKSTRLINSNQLGQALSAREKAVMSIFVYGANPAVTFPDQNSVLRGLAREDLFTVVHERFMTDTAKYADVVLPATTAFEHSDIYRAVGHYAVQLARQVIPPLGQAKSNWQVFALLARAMGFDDPFFQRSEDEIIDTVLIPSAQCWQADAVAALQAGNPVELPLAAGYKTNFKTSSGKIEILNSMEADALPKYYPPYGGEGKYWFVSSPDRRLLNSSFNERADLVGGDKMVLQMNPADARRNALSDGQLVVAWNNQGEATFKLRITENVPQCVVVSEGLWWIGHTGGTRSVNALTSQSLTDKAHGSTFYDTKVNIRAAGNA